MLTTPLLCCAAAIAVTAVAVVLPSRNLELFGHEMHSQYAIILAAMVLWGVAEGYGCAPLFTYPSLKYSFRCFVSRLITALTT